MIKALSVTEPYHLVWSGDPALDAPPIPTIEREDDETDAAWKARHAEYMERDDVKARLSFNERFRIAQQTGTKEAWASLLKPNQTPTLFRMRQVPTLITGKLVALVRSGELDMIGEAFVLVFRTALDGIENWAPGTKFDVDPFKAVDAEYRKLGQIATPEVCNKLTLPLMNEIGKAVMDRLQAPDPLS